MHLHIAALTHPGKVRERNEDTIAVGNWITSQAMDVANDFNLDLSIPQILLIADGMGGHQGGKVASEWVAAALSSELAMPELNETSLIAALRDTNRGLFENMKQDKSLLGMGSTVAGLYLHNGLAWAFNVGDSRVYWVQGDFLAQLSTDDILETPSYGDVVNQPKTGRITQALGGATNFIDIMPHLRQIHLRPGHVFLLCSDGLSDMLNLDEMESSLTQDLTQTTNHLFTQAMAAGGTDNISILLARVTHSPK